jgi:hypothetical protein
MGADLRSMRRAHRLGWYAEEAKARAVAEACYTTGEFGKFTSTPNKQVYKITYPNGKIYVGMDLLGNCTHFGSPSRKARQLINGDLADQRLDFTVRKEILWESDTATDAEVRAKEIEFIRLANANNPQIGYNQTPRFRP